MWKPSSVQCIIIIQNKVKYSEDMNRYCPYFSGVVVGCTTKLIGQIILSKIYLGNFLVHTRVLRLLRRHCHCCYCWTVNPCWFFRSGTEIVTCAMDYCGTSTADGCVLAHCCSYHLNPFSSTLMLVISFRFRISCFRQIAYTFECVCVCETRRDDRVHFLFYTI